MLCAVLGDPDLAQDSQPLEQSALGGRLRCPMLCLKAGLDIASAVSCYGIGKPVIYSDASME